MKEGGGSFRLRQEVGQTFIFSVDRAAHLKSFLCVTAPEPEKICSHFTNIFYFLIKRPCI